MPKKIPPLSDTTLRNAKPGDKQKFLNDGEGLTFRVEKSGSITVLLRYTVPGKKKLNKKGEPIGIINNIKLGNYPSLSLTGARELRAKYRGLLAQGIDPAIWRRENHQKTLQQSRTINSEFESWLTLNFTDPKPKYIKTIRGQFKNHILPSLGDVPLINITRSIAIDCLSPLKVAGKTATLKDCCELLTRFMAWSTDRGYVEHNRLQGISKHFKIKKGKHFPTIAPSKMSELLSDINHSTAKAQTKNAILFQLATLTRPNETATAKWEHFDLTNKVWRIPAEDMKMNKPHTVFLNDYVVNILQEQQKVRGSGKYVFPHNKIPTKHMSASTANCAIKRMGYKGVLVAHGLRALASTTMNEVGFNRDYIEASLSHLDDDEMRRIYNNAEYIVGRHHLSQWWGNWLSVCADKLNTPPLPLVIPEVRDNPYTRLKQRGQNDDNYYTVGHTGISALQQVAMG